ncbi:MAG: hypothetical protein ACRDMW_07395, partial [Gaiellaceae bacterium]
GDLFPVLGSEADFVGVRVVGRSDGADELGEGRCRRGSLVVAVAASDGRESDDRQADGKRQANVR